MLMHLSTGVTTYLYSLTGFPLVLTCLFAAFVREWFYSRLLPKPSRLSTAVILYLRSPLVSQVFVLGSEDCHFSVTAVPRVNSRATITTPWVASLNRSVSKVVTLVTERLNRLSRRTFLLLNFFDEVSVVSLLGREMGLCIFLILKFENHTS